MASIQDLIGSEFERFFSNSFPGFVNTTEDLRVPDFHNPDYNFWVEAKVGNQRWGPRIKKYQIEQFKDLREPVVYAAGFHDYDDAIRRLGCKSEANQKRALRERMHFSMIVFVNSDLMASIWEKDSRVSKERAEEYLMFKSSVVRNIISNRPFKRWGEVISSAPEYYHFNQSAFLMTEPKPGQITAIGTMLHREKDQRVIDYLAKLKLI
jgi:hypothetical protein